VSHFDKNYRLLIFLTIVAFIVILSTNNLLKSSFGMEKLHERTLEEVVKHPFELGKIADIPVGNHPLAISFSYPNVYVANYESNTLSVINADTNEWIKDIPVGDGPEDSPDDIAFNAWTNQIYVAKQLSNTVSVINGNTNEWIKNIPFGEHPQFIAFNADSNSLYVSNSFSDTISLIDGISDKVVAGFTFHINPPYSGYIKCDRLNAPTNEYFYVIPGTNCIAKPNTGFEFQSWAENLENNSSQLINGSRPSLPWDSFLELLRLKSSDEPEANIKITKFGTFTAKFKELPPPIPPEFWIQSYVLVGTVIAGLSIPSIVGWIKSKMDARKLTIIIRKLFLYMETMVN